MIMGLSGDMRLSPLYGGDITKIVTTYSFAFAHFADACSKTVDMIDISHEEILRIAKVANLGIRRGDLIELMKSEVTKFGYPELIDAFSEALRSVQDSGMLGSNFLQQRTLLMGAGAIHTGPYTQFGRKYRKLRNFIDGLWNQKIVHNVLWSTCTLLPLEGDYAYIETKVTPDAVLSVRQIDLDLLSTKLLIRRFLDRNPLGAIMVTGVFPVTSKNIGAGPRQVSQLDSLAKNTTVVSQYRMIHERDKVFYDDRVETYVGLGRVAIPLAREARAGEPTHTYTTVERVDASFNLLLRFVQRVAVLNETRLDTVFKITWSPREVFEAHVTTPTE